MSETLKPEPPSQQKAAVLRRESVCDEFEQAVLAGNQPAIESYLQKVDSDARPALFRELLLIELHYFDRLGESPDFAKYPTRFAQYQSLLDELSANRQLWQYRRDESAETQLRAERKSESTPAQGRRIHVRCPHCHEAMDVATDAPLTGVVCDLCGSQFSLVDDALQASSESLTSIAHYELRSRIGVGGFGTVWRAVDTKLDRVVAVKIPRSGQLDPKQELQLINEARSAAQLNHPNIVAVHEVGRCDNTIYIVSDLVIGDTLSDWIEKQHPARSECVDVCIKIADALHHAHQAGVVHRDMKASNVLIDDDGEPKITDFGLAKRETVETTIGEDGKVFGTPAYMSPEQARGEGHHADRRTDVYSLGVVLFQALTEELPFRGNAGSLLFQTIHNDPPSPRKLNESVPRDLETICLKCLEKDPGKRYQTAKEMADELRRFKRGEPIVSRPISRMERTWRWCRRHPMSAIAAGLLAVIAVAGPIVAIRERLHFLKVDTLNQEITRNIQQLTSERDQLERQLNALPAELPGMHEQPRVTLTERKFMRLAYDRYQPTVESILRGTATPLDRCLASLGLAILSKETNPSEEALDLLLKARDELESAAADATNNLQIKAGLAFCYDSLSELCSILGKPELARVYGEKAEAVWLQLAALNPTLTNYRAVVENRSTMAGLDGIGGGAERELSFVNEELPLPSPQQLETFFPSNPKDLYETACELAGCRAWLTQGQVNAEEVGGAPDDNK